VEEIKTKDNGSGIRGSLGQGSRNQQLHASPKERIKGRKEMQEMMSRGFLGV